MAKKRVNITITEETQKRILQYAYENHLQGGLSGAIEHIAWQVLKVKNAQSKGQTSIKVDNKWHTVIKGTKTIDEYLALKASRALAAEFLSAYVLTITRYIAASALNAITAL